MWNLLLEHLPTILLYIPLLMTLLLYTIIFRLKRNKWQAIHLAVQWSVIFYIIAVALLLEDILQVSLLGYILIFIIIVLAGVLIIQWKKKTEVILSEAFKISARILFLLFIFIYISLLVYLLINYIITIQAS